MRRNRTEAKLTLAIFLVLTSMLLGTPTVQAQPHIALKVVHVAQSPATNSGDEESDLWIGGIALSPDEKSIAIAIRIGDQLEIREVDLLSGQILRTLSLNEYANKPYVTQIRYWNNKLIGVSLSDKILLFGREAATWHMIWQQRFATEVGDFDFRPFGEGGVGVVVTTADNRVWVYSSFVSDRLDLQGFIGTQPVRSPPADYPWKNKVLLTADGSLAALMLDESTQIAANRVKVWKLDSMSSTQSDRRPVYRHMLRSFKADSLLGSWPSSFDISQDGLQLVVGGAMGDISIYDLRSFRRTRRIMGLTWENQTDSSSISAVKFSPNGRNLYAAGGGILNVFDTKTWSVLASDTLHRGADRIEISADGKWLATQSSDAVITWQILDNEDAIAQSLQNALAGQDEFETDSIFTFRSLATRQMYSDSVEARERRKSEAQEESIRLRVEESRKAFRISGKEVIIGRYNADSLTFPISIELDSIGFQGYIKVALETAKQIRERAAEAVVYGVLQIDECMLRRDPTGPARMRIAEVRFTHPLLNATEIPVISQEEGCE